MEASIPFGWLMASSILASASLVILGKLLFK